MSDEWNEEIIGNYFYDLAYYEGIRNTLMIINKNLSFAGSPKENINRLLEEIREELDDAHRMHKDSERAKIQMEADLGYNQY